MQSESEIWVYAWNRGNQRSKESAGEETESVKIALPRKWKTPGLKNTVFWNSFKDVEGSNKG